MFTLITVLLGVFGIELGASMLQTDGQTNGRTIMTLNVAN